MATYKSKQELEGKTLEMNDEVIFTVNNKVLEHTVGKYKDANYYLNNPHSSNIAIFLELLLDRNDFVENLGIKVSNPTGVFPYHNSLEDLTITTTALFAECEKANKPKGVVDLSIIPEWEVGDVVWFNSWWVIASYNEATHWSLYCIQDEDPTEERTFTANGFYYDQDIARSLLTPNEALLCFGLTPPDDILKLSAKIKAENNPEPEIEEVEEWVEVKLTKTQYNKLLNLLNE